MKRNIYTLLTYYKFVSIPDLEGEIKEHKKFCTQIGMKWRIYIGPEWISATLTGNDGQVMAYKLYMQSKYWLRDVDFLDLKATKVDDYYFDKMVCKYRDEIVKLDYMVTQEEVEKYKQEISIEDFKQIMENWDDKKYAILDMRNSYEYKLWHFRYAEPSGTVNFREVWELIEAYKARFGNKKVIMYCTWGIRCEKLAVMLHKYWLKNFYSLQSGIVGYVNYYDDGNWLWNLYTFDGRVSTHIWTKKTHTTIWRCIYTDSLTDNIENCRYWPCNARIICKPKEYRKHLWFCSLECYIKAKKDLRIKDDSFDKNNYQDIRNKIKKYPKQEEQYKTKVVNFLDSRLSWLDRRHKTSQKEEYIDCEC